MKLVVDTNIIFSALLGKNATNSCLEIIKSHEVYYCAFLSQEIKEHKDKLVAISKLSEAEIYESFKLLTKPRRLW